MPSHDTATATGTTTVQQALRAALRDVVGPAARAHGFRGSAPTWRRTNDRGDHAIVNVQSSQFSTRRLLPCVVNLSVAPAPWLDWIGSGSVRPVPKAVSEAFGLYRERLHPTGATPGMDIWWDITHPDQVAAVAADMVRQLDRSGWPVLERLLDRGALLEEVTRLGLGAHARAVLLCDDGPSAELDAALALALAEARPPHLANAERFDAWARARAAARGDVARG
jgi:hypothetical protein